MQTGETEGYSLSPSEELSELLARLYSDDKIKNILAKMDKKGSAT